MNHTIRIDPVTRIEGHAKVFLDMADDGSLEAAGLVVNELRGFERILVGMEADRMPLITARICGVCPTAHHLAASKALDAAAGVEPPPAAHLLRELMYMGHFIHSHALSLFVLQGPDIILGMDADPATRNVVGLVQAAPDAAKKALRLRTLGQKINELIGGRGTHPVTSVAGGITFAMDSDNKKALTGWIREATSLAFELSDLVKGHLIRAVEQHPALLSDWELPTWYMGTVKDGCTNFYDGELRVIDEDGDVREEFMACDYRDHLAEQTLPWSYMKPTFFQNDGELVTYRVNTLGRVNCTDAMATPRAQQELEEFRKRYGHPCHLTVMHAYARLIELLYACERAGELVRDPKISGETRVPAKLSGAHGIGQVEAPRGSLFHEYEIDERGIVRSANLIVATQQNYAAINESIGQAAESYVVGKGDSELLNAIEFAIRCYDPCLSCATHAMGQMPLEVAVRRKGRIIHEIQRGEA